MVSDFDPETANQQIISTLENRRQEINSKANVYIAFSVALIAGCLAVLNATSAPSAYTSMVLVAAIIVALSALWNFVGLIRSLPSRSRSKDEKGRLLFFGWLAGKTPEYVLAQIATLDGPSWNKEVAQQIVALSKNIKFRYDNQKVAINRLRLAIILFGVSVVNHIFGVIDWLACLVESVLTRC